MRQVREVLRLTTAGVGLNEIARRVGVAPSTVRLTLKRLASAGLSWPLPAEMTDSALETALFAGSGSKQGHRVEDVDYRAPRGLDRALFHKLTNGEWIDAHDNLILCGPTDPAL